MNFKHGLVKSKTYNSWTAMRYRCDNKKHPDYKNYGGRGITYDPRWKDLLNFISDMGECPEGHSLERIDSNGNYTKSNCKWIPHNQQSYNRRISLRYTFNEKTQTLGQWCKEYNKQYHTVYARIRVGYSFEIALLSDDLR